MYNIIIQIEEATSEQQVFTLLSNLKVKELKVIADYFNVYIPNKNKANYINKIVSNTVRYKLRSLAIRNQI